MSAEGSDGGYEGARGKAGGSRSSRSSRSQGNTIATQTVGSGSALSQRQVNILSSNNERCLVLFSKIRLVIY